MSASIEEIRKKHFPFTLASGIVAHPSSREEVYAFSKSVFGQVFGDQVRPGFQTPATRAENMRAMVQRYATLHHEWILFRNERGENVGWFMGETEDTVTFYMRNTGILPEYRGKKIYTEFLDYFVSYLKEIGYERISSQHKVTNQKILLSKLKRGFIITNLEATENWGLMVKVTKFLVDDRLASFVSQYGDMDHLKFFEPIK